MGEAGKIHGVFKYIPKQLLCVWHCSRSEDIVNKVSAFLIPNILCQGSESYISQAKRGLLPVFVLPVNKNIFFSILRYLKKSREE